MFNLQNIFFYRSAAFKAFHSYLNNYAGFSNLERLSDGKPLCEQKGIKNLNGIHAGIVFAADQRLYHRNGSHRYLNTAYDNFICIITKVFY